MKCPNITGTSNIVGFWDANNPPTGAFAVSPEWSLHKTPAFDIKHDTMSSAIIVFDAHDGNATYGGASTVQPASISVQYLIKY